MDHRLVIKDFAGFGSMTAAQKSLIKDLELDAAKGILSNIDRRPLADFGRILPREFSVDFEEPASIWLPLCRLPRSTT